MDATTRLNLISQQGLCIGCGLCQAIAGPDRIRVTVTPNGYERPVVVGDVDDAIVDAVYEACPGTKVTGLPKRLLGNATIDPVWGPWERIVLTWAADPHVRYVGSTGGTLTALGMHLLDTGKVDAILHAGPSETEPSFGEARISRTSGEVLAATGSRYGPTAVFARLEEALVTARRLAVIAKPCDLSALRLRARRDPRIDEQITSKLAMVCGGFMAPAGLTERMEWHDIDRKSVTAIRYRGHGCPGPTRFERRDEAPIEISYLEFWGDDESKWTIPYRCKICPDGTAEAADIAAADTWPGATPTEEMLRTDPGTNVAIARTAHGAELLSDAVSSGHLAPSSEVTIDDLNLWQPHHVNKKRWSWARQTGRKLAGGIPIEIEGLRSPEIARTVPRRELLDQGHGSMLRVRDGRADEPVPTAR